VKVANEKGGITLQKVNVHVLNSSIPLETSIPTTTALNNVIIEINGQPGNRVWVNGIDTEENVNAYGVASIELDTSGEDGDKVFSLTLRDPLGNESNALTFTILKDSTVPSAPTLTIMPTVTSDDSVAVEVNGEIGSKVFVNGVDSGRVIAPSGKVLTTLDTSGVDGDKDFVIRLEDTLGNASEDLSFIIYRQSDAPPPVINNIKKQGWFDIAPESDIDVEQNIGNASTALDKNDILYIVYEKDGETLIVKRFNGLFWEIVGAEGFATQSGLNAITFDNNNIPYVFYRKTNGYVGNGSGVVKRFNGITWESVGNEFPAPNHIDELSILFDSHNVPYLAYNYSSDSTQVAVKKFNGTFWESLGSETLPQGRIYGISLDIDNNNVPYLAYKDPGSAGNAGVKRFNGASWAFLGASEGISQGNAGELSMSVDNNNVPYLYYRDAGSSYRNIFKRFSGDVWEDVQGPSGQYSNSALTSDDNNMFYLDYKSGSNSDLQRFDGTDWEILSDEGFGEGTFYNLSIHLDGNNNPYVTYNDFGEDILHVKRFYDGSINDNAYENHITAIDIDATDVNNFTLHYSLTDSYDAALFTSDESTGVVTFKTAPDLESPQDNNQDNIYTFEIKVDNGNGGITLQKVNITVIRDDQPTLTDAPPLSTAENSITVEINGNSSGERVFVNDVDTNITLSADKKAVVTLDTSGEEGYRAFRIKLKSDSVDYFSNTLSIYIYKDESAPELLSGWPTANEVIGLNHNNQLELIYTFTDKGGISSIKIYDHEGNDISESATIDSNSIVLNLTPEQDTSYAYTIVVIDSHGYEKEVSFSFDVNTYASTTITSLPSGLYDDSINVDLSSNKEATIYYSTDGYPPIVDAANTYQGVGEIKNIAISSTTNLQYFSIDIAGNREKINSAVYRFNEVDDYNTVITTSYDASNQQISLSWDDSVDAKAYKIYRVASKLDVVVLKNSKAKKYLAPAAYFLSDSVAGNFTDVTISNGANYYYAISKINQDGVETLISELVNVTVEPISAATNIRDSITRTKNWLYSTQNNSGSWGSTERLKLLATTSALDALHSVKDENAYVINKALMHVFGVYADNNDYLSRQILTLSTYGLYTDDKINKLLSQSYFYDNDIYGWGLLKRYNFNAFDTALAYKAIKTSGQDFQKKVWAEFILQNNKKLINSQGYWGWINRGETSIYVSSLVYSVSDSGRDDYAWIEQAQNIDGSFGGGLLDTIGVVLYLQLSQEQQNNAFAYIISQQNIMGDFSNDIYLSALALQALSQGVK
jgi:hypothetical protein